VSARAILGITGTGISTARRLLGGTKTIATDFLKLSTKLFSAALYVIFLRHLSEFNIVSRDNEMRVVRILVHVVTWVTGCRSEAVMT